MDDLIGIAKRDIKEGEIIEIQISQQGFYYCEAINFCFLNDMIAAEMIINETK